MTGQNMSSAVMMRRVEPADSLDDFPTQPWGTRALIMALDRFCEQTGHRKIGGPGSKCWEPAANRGFMARPLSERFEKVLCTDIHDYGVSYGVRNFLGTRQPGDDDHDWIITNPPFNRATKFILTALELARQGVAMLVRGGFFETEGRYLNLFKEKRPTLHLHYAERLPLLKGRVDSKASSATAYEWAVWLKEPESQLYRLCIEDWIPICRDQLELPGDYDLPVAIAGEPKPTPKQGALRLGEPA